MRVYVSACVVLCFAKQKNDKSRYKTLVARDTSFIHATLPSDVGAFKSGELNSITTNYPMKILQCLIYMLPRSVPRFIVNAKF